MGEDAATDVVRIIEAVTGIGRAALLAHPEREIDLTHAARIDELSRRRAAGEPLAYLLRSAAFYGHEFTVDDHVLVPRPETEHLVETALELVRERRDPSILDVGTGSGAIAIALAVARPDASVFGTDISAAAVALARTNAAAANAAQRCTFFVGDLGAPVARFAPFDLVVANLPYVPTAEIASPPDPVSYEPRIALDGGADGLDLYRRLAAELPLLAGERGIVVFEAGPMNLRMLGEVVDNSLPGRQLVFGRDYAGLDRVVAAVPRA